MRRLVLILMLAGVCSALANADVFTFNFSGSAGSVGGSFEHALGVTGPASNIMLTSAPGLVVPISLTSDVTWDVNTFDVDSSGNVNAGALSASAITADNIVSLWLNDAMGTHTTELQVYTGDYSYFWDVVGPRGLPAIQHETAAVPEPGSIVLLLTVLGGVAAAAKLKRKQSV